MLSLHSITTTTVHAYETPKKLQPIKQDLYNFYKIASLVFIFMDKHTYQITIWLAHENATEIKIIAWHYPMKVNMLGRSLYMQTSSGSESCLQDSCHQLDNMHRICKSD